MNEEAILEINDSNLNKDSCICVGHMSGGKWNRTYEQSCRIYSGNGISPTIHTQGGGNQHIKVIA